MMMFIYKNHANLAMVNMDVLSTGNPNVLLQAVLNNSFYLMSRAFFSSEIVTQQSFQYGKRSCLSRWWLVWQSWPVFHSWYMLWHRRAPGFSWKKKGKNSLAVLKQSSGAQYFLLPCMLRQFCVSQETLMSTYKKTFEVIVFPLAIFAGHKHLSC